MIFKVIRTSDVFCEESPVEESYPGKCLDTFHGPGKEKEEDCYLIEINTLEELMKIREKYGSIIIYEQWYNYPILEIYDDYRE